MDIDEIIDRYYRNPEFYRESEVFAQSISVKNQLCGDVITLGFKQDNILYTHKGCVISNVGMGVLCELHIQARPEDYLKHDLFKILEKFPTREKCLTLALDAYSKLLASISA